MVRPHRARPRTAIPLCAWVLVAFAPVEALALQTTRVASGLNRPIFVTAPLGDDRLFIVEQRGVIKILKEGSVLPAPFLDIDGLIPDPSNFDERGLLGLAFDPGFASNRRFYVNYYSLGNQTVIARYRASATNPDVAVPDSVETIITIAQPAPNHNGGTIAFSPVDGYLYLGMGDGGGSGDPQDRAQNPLEILGKYLRLDVSGASGYVVPASNPFVGNPAYRPEIWALGVRNPYRWSFDRLTGDLWIADVGQGAWEEVDFQPAGSAGGENYGWDTMEGNHCFEPPSGCDQTGLVLPIHEYSHGQGCSITGGYVYRGAAIPELQGTYFFADYCFDTIWSLRYNGTNVTEFIDRTAELAPGGGLTITDISGFGEDGFGELYIVDRGTTTTGEVYKLLPEPGDISAPTRGFGSGLELRSVAPNPSSGGASFSLMAREAGALNVEIIDVSGRSVRRFAARPVQAGAVTVQWDGRDEAGRGLPTGVYFARATLGGHTSATSIGIVR